MLSVVEDDREEDMQEDETLDKTPADEVRPPIDERIQQLEAGGKTKQEITLKLYQEGYSTHEIMKRHLPLKKLKRTIPREESSLQGAVEGGVKGTGYLQEIKDMVRSQVGRTRELTDEFYNLGLGTLFAALSKSGVSMDEFKKIVTQQEPLREAFRSAGETVFKALAYYQSDLITRVEEERDEARAYASLLDASLADVKRRIDPKVRLEKMIYNLVLLSGTVKMDPDTLTSLVHEWLDIQVITK